MNELKIKRVQLFKLKKLREGEWNYKYTKYIILYDKDLK